MRGRLTPSYAALCLSALTALVLAGSASPQPRKTYTVRVTARDFSFALSRRSVPAGSSVRFVVRNRGATVHDFVVRGRRTRLLRPGKAQTITVAFPRKGTFRFLCAVSGHARTRGAECGERSESHATAGTPLPPRLR